MEKEIKFNINQYVKVKLTQEGINIYESRNDKLNEYIDIHGGKKLKRPIYSEKCDSEGYIKMQMWDFMELFGEHIDIARQCPFETDIFFIIKEAQ